MDVSASISVSIPDNESPLHFFTKLTALDWISRCNSRNYRHIAPEVKLTRGEPDLLESTFISSRPNSERKFLSHIIEVELYLGNIKSMSENHYQLTEDLEHPDLMTLIVPYTIRQETEKCCPGNWQIATVRPSKSSEGKSGLQFDWIQRKTSIELPLRSKEVYNQVRRRINKASEKFIRTRLGRISFDQDIDFQELFDELE